ncbi:MAG: DUF4166 domain-containing protein [Pseudomonadota bacterium]
MRHDQRLSSHESQDKFVLKQEVKDKFFVNDILSGDAAERRFHAGTGDYRFKNLLGKTDWNRLPPAIRKRFGKRFGAGESTVYQGVVKTMKLNAVGWFLAQTARLVGAPLPFDVNSVGQPAVVCVTEDIETQGQFWIRQYGRKDGFPQVVHSSKRFAGPTGLEEYIGYGIGIALRMSVSPDTLYFVSDHYFLHLFGRRIRLPKFFEPGVLEIGHRELGKGFFAFTLDLRHRLFGKLVDQEAVFTDPVAQDY